MILCFNVIYLCFQLILSGSLALQGTGCRLQFWSILVQATVDGNSDVLYNIETEFLENLLQENVGSCK